ncbi:MAG TPA: FAD-dependent oxidoreductase, partial [Flexistipes sinusarabici]|nr:FAD-dependent oxidoreductase [Flexistipes sinusarabici]
RLDKIMPGIADPNTLLYGVEVKFYSLRIDVNENLKSKSIENLYCIGDGAGITRGIIQASTSG